MRGLGEPEGHRTLPDRDVAFTGGLSVGRQSCQRQVTFDRQACSPVAIHEQAFDGAGRGNFACPDYATKPQVAKPVRVLCSCSNRTDRFPQMIYTLDRLLGAAGTGRLLEHLSEHRRLHIRREQTGSATELLPWTAFDRLIARDSVRPERLKVMLRNREVERSMYREPGSGALRSDTLMTMAAQGASLVVNVICDVAVPNPLIRARNVSFGSIS